MGLDRSGELSRERFGALKQFVQRPAGDLVLVEREDRVPALIGSLHGPETTRLGPGDVLAAARVDPDPLALLDEERDLDHHTGLQRGGLRAAA